LRDGEREGRREGGREGGKEARKEGGWGTVDGRGLTTAGINEPHISSGPTIRTQTGGRVAIVAASDMEKPTICTKTLK
jgi:hypothetical protein